ncbi:MAG: acetylornithine aminotransferase [Mariprofundus sp.]
MTVNRKYPHDKPGRDFLKAILIIIAMYGIYHFNALSAVLK